MDSSPDVLADEVRMKRHAVDNDLELLRVRVQQSRPTSQDAIHWAQRVLPVLAGAAGVWWWTRRRRSVDSLDALLVHALDELYQGEQQLVPALHRMAAQASDRELKKAFETHYLETAIHVDRLERVFRAVGARRRRGGNAVGLAGIIADADHLLRRKVDPDVRDAWLIATAQRIEHVEISAYGTARTYAEMLGFDRAARLLQETLEEERTTDEKLTRLAKGFVNPQSIRSGTTH
jgi:ferritin-like metal-binding protein YciE